MHFLTLASYLSEKIVLLCIKVANFRALRMTEPIPELAVSFSLLPTTSCSECAKQEMRCLEFIIMESRQPLHPLLPNLAKLPSSSSKSSGIFSIIVIWFSGHLFFKGRKGKPCACWMHYQLWWTWPWCQCQTLEWLHQRLSLSALLCVNLKRFQLFVTWICWLRKYETKNSFKEIISYTLF